MRKVDLQLSRLSCPDYCCRCGKARSELRSFSERIALRPVTPVKVSIQVPVCSRCAGRKLFFYVAAIAVLALALVALKFVARGSLLAWLVVALFPLAIGLYVVAVRSTPIKILDYRPSTDTISLGCLHPGFAAELAALSGGTETEYVRVRKIFWMFALLVLMLTVVAIGLGF